MHLNYKTLVPAEDIVGRLLGPDMFGAYVQAVSVEHWMAPECVTRVKVRPVGPDELTHMTRDQYGQWWLPLPDAQVGAA